MYWIYWLIIWFIAALPLERIFIRDRDFDPAFAVARFLFIFVIGIFAILLNIPDGLMIWTLVIFVLIIITLLSGNTSVSSVSGFLFIIAFIALLIAVITAGVNNAVYFDSFISKSTDFPVNNEVPDDMLRLTTEELARSIASQHMGEFGSAVQITDSHVSLYKGRLCWIVIIAKEEAWGAKFKTAGLVIIDANDPDRPPEVLRERFDVAKGLNFNPIIGAWGAVEAKYYGIDTALAYGDTYPVLTPDNRWTIAVDTYRTEWSYVRKYSGVYQLDQRGEVIEYYRDNVPAWMIKPFDEDNFLEVGIDDWGRHKRGDGFDLFASGVLWIPPSNDRLEITEDTRYVYDPDNRQIVALTMMHPIRDRGELSLAGTFKSDSKGIVYHDLRNYNLMSGKAASGIVQSKITARADTSYYTAMELLYPLKIGNDTRYVWFVPIYYQSASSGLIGLAGLGIVDAQAADKVVIEYTGEGLTGEKLIAKTKMSFMALYGQKPATEPTDGNLRTIEGQLMQKFEPYDIDGNTRQWFSIKTEFMTEDYLVRSDLISDGDMLKIQKLKVGSAIKADVDDNNAIRKIF